MGLGVEVAPPGPAGAVGQDLDGQRTWALGEQKASAAQSRAKAPGPGGAMLPPPLWLSGVLG